MKALPDVQEAWRLAYVELFMKLLSPLLSA